MSPLEKVAGGVGVAIPAVALIWYGAMQIEHVEHLRSRMLTLEAQVTSIEREQATDAVVNKDVEALKREVDWLRYHHHDDAGGRGHVDG